LAALQAQTVPKVTLSNSIEFPESIAINHRAPSQRRLPSGLVPDRRVASFGPFVLLAQEVSFGGIQRCVERQPQLRVDMHQGDKLFAARTSATPRLVCRDRGLNLACPDP